MSETWKQWEGQLVDGKFPLVRYLGGSKHSAVFLTERRKGERLVDAAIKLIPVDGDDAQLHLSRWRLAAQLSHPNLIPLYEMGRIDAEGMPLVYVVMECAEENLAQVLGERALIDGEARMMLASVLDVLDYLHGKGFVHGHLKPANIMASGDNLKVSSDGLSRAGEPVDRLADQEPYDAPENAPGIIPIPVSAAASPAGDVWALGVTLVETLTQNLPVARTAEQRDPLLPPSLKEPFRDIASHCLVRRPEGRWTVAQIADRLEGRVSEPPAPRAAAPEPRPMPPGSRAAIPPYQPAARQSKPRSSPPSRSSRPPGYGAAVVVGVALVLALILAGTRLLRRHPDTPEAPAATAERPLIPSGPSAPSQPAQPLPEHSNKADNSIVADKEPRAAAPAPVPAVIHPEAVPEEANAVAKFPAGSAVPGAVAHQAQPEVLQSARNSIRGTVRVSVKVDVDQSGNVEDASLESGGPSKYFARAAVEAARNFKFKPPTVAGRGVLSTWILQFQFTRDATTVASAQEMP